MFGAVVTSSSLQLPNTIRPPPEEDKNEGELQGLFFKIKKSPKTSAWAWSFRPGHGRIFE